MPGHIIYFMGGPFDGMMRREESDPQPSVAVAVQSSPATNTFESANYRLYPMGQNAQAFQTNRPCRYAAEYTGREIQDPAITEESGILCAHCGHDPATGEEAD